MESTDIMKYRKHLRDTIHVLKRQGDSDRKFEKLLKMTLEYEKMTDELLSSGRNVKTSNAEWMKYSYWVNEFNRYKGIETVKDSIRHEEPLVIKDDTKKRKTKTVKNPPSKTTVKDNKELYKNITSKTVKNPPSKTTVRNIKNSITVPPLEEWKIRVSWTITSHLQCTSCDKVISVVKEYLLNMGLTESGSGKDDFGNKIEYYLDFKFTGQKPEYEILLKSAEYIINIVGISDYEKCNAGVYGKKIKKM